MYLDISDNKLTELTLPEKKDDMERLRPFPLLHLNLAGEENWHRMGDAGEI